jgi:non-heme chloroperoxidase
MMTSRARPVLWPFALAVAALSQPLAGQPAPAGFSWVDPSPHVVRFVAVAPGVTLEVLDWGGKGPPLVFLAGAGNTAHVWDDFAPGFCDRFHVLGITRRGFGASTKTVSGYDAETLAADIIAVLDSLRVPRALFVAHSFGGAELNELATHYPARVGGAIYLEAAFDFKGLYAAPGWWDTPFPHPPEPTGADTTSLTAYAAYWSRINRWVYPESEIHAEQLSPTVPGDHLKLRDGAKSVDYAAIQERVLAIYARPRTPREMFRFWDVLDSAGRLAAQRRFDVWERVMLPQHERFRRDVRQAQVVEIPGADHYVFLSHTDSVVRLMRGFLESSAFRSASP